MKSVVVFQRKTRSGRTWAADIPCPRTGKTLRRSPFADQRLVIEVLGRVPAPEERTKDMALRLAVAMQSEWDRQEEAPTLTVAEWLTLARQDPGRPQRGGRELSVGHRRNRDRHLQRFADFLRREGIEQIADVRRVTVRKFVTEQVSNGAPRGCEKILRAVARAYRYVGRLREIELPCPIDFEQWRQCSVSDRRASVRSRAYTDLEMDELYAAAVDSKISWLPSILVILRGTGLRPGELLGSTRYETQGLRWTGVDLDEGSMEVFGKTGSRTVIIADDLVEFLRRERAASETQWVIADRQGAPVVSERAQQAFRRMVRRIREHEEVRANLERRPVRLIPEHGLYGYRHAYALRLADRGVPMHLLKEVMGHASITTTEQYARTNVEQHAGVLRAALSVNETTGLSAGVNEKR